MTSNLAPNGPLVLLREGAAGVPLFITHGLGGRIGEVRNVVAGLPGGRPIYGLQWQGLDGAPPHLTIEEMAEYFAGAIASRQPHGPYLLAGWSVGGLVMLQVARLLSQRGEDVAMLALVDAYPHASHWPMRLWAGIMLRRAVHHLSAMVRMPWRQAAAEFSKRSRGLWNRISARRGTASIWQDADDGDVPPALRLLRDRGYQAYAQYLPLPYAGRVVFLRAGVATVFPRDPAGFWRALLPHMEVYTIPCDHVTLGTTHARLVADQLALCIGES